jgi:signal transduction histidine kinase
VSVALDASVELAQLVPIAELVELVVSVQAALSSEVGVFDRDGKLLAGAPLGQLGLRRPIDHNGRTIGEIAARGSDSHAALQVMGTSLALLVQRSVESMRAADSHDQALRRTFAELTDHNQRLKRAVARLEELDRLKSNFLATMSHELRTPLTSVIGYAEMMAGGFAGSLNSEQREYLVTILYKAEQLLGTITSVLDAASLESGPVILERGPVSLAEVVASEVATYAPQAAKHGIVILVDNAAEGHIIGDKKKIRQVVSSLVSNALKFTIDHGSVLVALRPGALSPHEIESSCAVQLVVTDSGIGIPRDQVAKIFEPFFQVDSSSTRAFGGTGLGLTLAKAYVEAHGGRIWVDSTPGSGSTFTATFPVGDPALGEATAGSSD